MSWAHAPVAGRRACRSDIIGRRARLRVARPRSAVAVSPPAPELSLLTGFSRSGRFQLSQLARHRGRSATSVGVMRPSPGLAAECGRTVYNRVPSYVRTGDSTQQSVGPPGIHKDPGGHFDVPPSPRSRGKSKR